jgi:hypothetical protein
MSHLTFEAPPTHRVRLLRHCNRLGLTANEALAEALENWVDFQDSVENDPEYQAAKPEDEPSEPQAKHTVPSLDRIYIALHDGPLTQPQLAEATGIPLTKLYSMVSSMVHRYQEAEKTKKNGATLVHLTDKGEQNYSKITRALGQISEAQQDELDDWELNGSTPIAPPDPVVVQSIDDEVKAS